MKAAPNSPCSKSDLLVMPFGIFPFLSCAAHFLRLRRHNAVQLGIFREAVYKGQNDAAIEQKPLARFGMGDVAHLLRGDIELLRKDSPVARRLMPKYIPGCAQVQSA